MLQLRSQTYWCLRAASNLTTTRSVATSTYPFPSLAHRGVNLTAPGDVDIAPGPGGAACESSRPRVQLSDLPRTERIGRWGQFTARSRGNSATTRSAAC